MRNSNFLPPKVDVEIHGVKTRGRQYPAGEFEADTGAELTIIPASVASTVPGLNPKKCAVKDLASVHLQGRELEVCLQAVQVSVPNSDCTATVKAGILTGYEFKGSQRIPAHDVNERLLGQDFFAATGAVIDQRKGSLGIACDRSKGNGPKDRLFLPGRPMTPPSTGTLRGPSSISAPKRAATKRRR